MSGTYKRKYTLRPRYEIILFAVCTVFLYPIPSVYELKNFFSLSVKRDQLLGGLSILLWWNNFLLEKTIEI